jgi:hypothetical protein
MTKTQNDKKMRENMNRRRWKISNGKIKRRKFVVGN